MEYSLSHQGTQYAYSTFINTTNNLEKTCINLTNRSNKISEGHKSGSFSFASHIVTYMSEKRDAPLQIESPA